MYILLLLLAIGPEQGETNVVVDHVDIIEINYYYGWIPEGAKKVEPSVSQVIWWEWRDDVLDWNGHPGCYVVVAWRMLRVDGEHITNNSIHSKQAAASYNYRSNSYESVFFDDNTLRVVVAGSFSISHTMYDPEAENRRRLPADKRRGLTPLIKPKEIVWEG